jgi:hypothetical protein
VPLKAKLRDMVTNPNYVTVCEDGEKICRRAARICILKSKRRDERP